MFHLGELTEAEQQEMQALGIMDSVGRLCHPIKRTIDEQLVPLDVRRVYAETILNEASSYSIPSSFSRATVFQIADSRIMLISGTASVNEHGETVHVGNFAAQCWRTYRNIMELLRTEDMTWHHIVRTTCYLRDIERDYESFNKIRTRFFSWLGLNPLPASTAIQATICRPDLLIEIEAIAAARVRIT
jgi:enamine deaminase RidA (YjgF/YER057c/UK114 family)